MIWRWIETKFKIEKSIKEEIMNIELFKTNVNLKSLKNEIVFKLQFSAIIKTKWHKSGAILKLSKK